MASFALNHLLCMDYALHKIYLKHQCILETSNHDSFTQKQHVSISVELLHCRVILYDGILGI